MAPRKLLKKVIREVFHPRAPFLQPDREAYRYVIVPINDEEPSPPRPKPQGAPRERVKSWVNEQAHPETGGETSDSTTVEGTTGKVSSPRRKTRLASAPH